MSTENRLPDQIMEEVQAGKTSSSDQPAPSAVGKLCVPRKAKIRVRAEVPVIHTLAADKCALDT